MLSFLMTGLGLVNASPEISFDYAPFRGLQVMVGDTAVIEGSGFQYYEAGWKQGYFSSAWKPITIFKNGDGSTTVIANSDDGRVANRQVFTPTPTGYKAFAEFRWRGEKPAMLEYNVGRLWAPFVAQGSFSVDARKVSGIDTAMSASSSFESRLLGSGKEIVFDGPSAKVRFQSEQVLNVVDGRNYTVEWADGKELFWLGLTNQEIQPQGSVRFDYEVSIESVPIPDKNSDTVVLPVAKLESAQSSDVQSQPVVPQPKQIKKTGSFVEVVGGFQFKSPKEIEGDIAWFDRFILSRWQWLKSGAAYPVVVKISPTVTKPNGYQLDVRSDGAVIVGQSAEGARYGLRTLGQLVTSKNGSLVLPTVSITDWPSLQWRGVHLFVGPTALQFQSKLMDQVLAPLKLNKVVLQCERTQWDSVPGIETGITMKKGDLAQLSSRYKSEGFEVIPLIQSMGHMEWFFANKKNLELAVNPDIPYTIDPRKAESRTKISGIWGEVQRAVKPKVAHFGLDEIDMRGIDDKNLTTRLWEKGLPMLQSIAKEHKMTPMVWSDMLLAPGEAVDACHAPSQAAAEQRRKMLTKGTYVADWHYRDDPKPETFDKSLAMWNSMGMKPIASTWFRPGNVRGFTLSAIKNNAGVLQTTWAGYESNEANFVREFKQFAAFVMMADYAWSGRTEMPDKLGYDSSAYLQKLYFGGRQSVKPVAGMTLGSGTESLKIGAYNFRRFDARQLFGITQFDSFNSPHQLNLPVSESANDVVLAMDCLATINEVALAGNVVIRFEDGTSQKAEIRYGTDVRSVTDTRSTIASPRAGSLSAIRISTGGKQLKSIEIVASNSAAGLRLHAVTLL
ncbi:MAG: glycoside hydrolase family 20 zincin-like fold domain-containing protein [Fimbriimonadaceae bacterium]